MRQIPGFPGYYITTCGRIFSVKSKTIKEMKKKTTQAGYETINFYHAGKQHTIFVHKLVCITYMERPIDPKYNQINHKNGDKLMNSVPNLEWCTAQQNSIHAYATGLSKTEKEEYSVKGINLHDKKDILMFQSCADAERHFGRDPRSTKGVNRTIRGKQKSAYGYKWVKIPKYTVVVKDKTKKEE
ncbi:MAG: hypothetical protein ACRDCW_06815 [Sarcina sp.]